MQYSHLRYNQKIIKITPSLFYLIIIIIIEQLVYYTLAHSDHTRLHIFFIDFFPTNSININLLTNKI